MKKFNLKLGNNICPFCGSELTYNDEYKIVYCKTCKEKGHAVQFKYKDDPQEAFDYANTRNGENELLEKLQDLYAYLKQLGIEGQNLEDISVASEGELPNNGWIITEEAVALPCEEPHDVMYSHLVTDKSINLSDRQAVCNSLHCINVTYVMKVLDIYIPKRYNAKQKEVLTKICSKYPKDTKIEIEYLTDAKGKQFETFDGISDFLLFLDTI